ncbi:MAG: cytochrome C biogenesis protein [candidate division Zixibacteria bacterium]|nr:cytochrome C biogenesis protein [candidate division Zixibacteria bacterium]
MQIILLVLMSGVIIAVWLTPPPQSMLGEVSRIFFFHVPSAWVAVLAFAVSMLNSVGYLRTHKVKYDIRAATSAELGLMFTIVATISGAVFAHKAWGIFWNWDPRETSIFFLLLIYGAYLALRSAVDSEERRARLSAVYSIFAFITVPFLVFVIPRIYQSLHPGDTIIDSSGSIQMPPPILAVFLTSMLCFTLLYFWLYNLQSRILEQKRNIEVL